jgi:hypothetical protein
VYSMAKWQYLVTQTVRPTRSRSWWASCPLLAMECTDHALTAVHDRIHHTTGLWSQSGNRPANHLLN